MSSPWTALMQSSGCLGCSLGSTEKPSCSYGRTSQPFPLIKAPTSKKATKGVLCFQEKAAASRGQPALHLPRWGHSLQKQTQGIWCVTVTFKLEMVITFHSAVVLAWVSKPSFPHQHLGSNLCHTGVFWESHIVGHSAIHNISLYESTTAKTRWNQSLRLGC